MPNKLRKVYNSIRRRCYNEKYDHYNRYGGRGIICEWNSFEEFYEDMKDTYREGLTIDRIDNDGNYSKANCKWSTHKEQARNRTGRCRMITYNGKTQPLAAWVEDTGIKSSTIRMRLTYGWSIGKALGFE